MFIHENGQVVLQFDKTGTGSLATSDLSHRYLWADIVDELLADEQIDWSDNDADGEVLWTLTDHAGTVRDVVDSNATVRLHRVFDAYGNATSATHYNASGVQVASGTMGAIDVIVRWTGKLFDVYTATQNSQARWYDPSTGTFLSHDPLELDVNSYRYGFNSPTGYIDPTGEGSISIVGRLTRNGYQGLRNLIRREGLSALFEVHHKIGLQFFRHGRFGPWLRGLGFQEDDLCNVIALPTKGLKDQAARRGQPIRRAGHGGRHINAYVEDVVRPRLDQLMKQHQGNLGRLGKARADQIAQQGILALQKELQGGLRDGSIQLQHWDDGSVISLGGLFLLVPEKFELSKSGMDALGLGTASHYTGEEGLLGWSGWLVDLVNPVEDFKFLCETTEQMVIPLNQWSSDYLRNALDNKRHNIRTDRYANVPGGQAMIQSMQVSAPLNPRPAKPANTGGFLSNYWHYLWHPFGG